MIFSSARKRARDVEDDFDLTDQPFGKKTKPTTAVDSPLSVSASKSQWQFLQSPSQKRASISASEHDSVVTNASEAGSVTDDSMDTDMDDQSHFWSPDPAAGDLTPTTAPSASSWTSMPCGPAPGPISKRGSIDSLMRPVRPKIYPLQNQSLSSDTVHRRNAHDFMRSGGSGMSITTDRLPSPVDDDEPHTPTTAAGSQLSLLSVGDMDVDSGSTTPVRQGGVVETASVLRKQRQRSGAFISPPEVAKRIQFGYRGDCIKCHDKVPGHMNHFLGS